jgi:hypothetical protein
MINDAIIMIIMARFVLVSQWLLLQLLLHNLLVLITMASTVRMLKIYAEVLEAIAKLVPTLDAESSNCKPIYNLR